MTERGGRVGIYLHIPFCRAKCRYCDFCSRPPREDELRRYTAALCADIASRRATLRGRVADTVYFGGGTPSLLTPRLVDRLLCALSDVVTLESGAEISLECNPATVDEAALAELRRAGVNRLSIGAQSLCDDELTMLGRLHDAGAVGDTVRAAKRGGFDNISLDIMYGIPLQTRDSLAATLRGILELEPQHVSAYGLRVEPGTPFGTMEAQLHLPDEDSVADMYLDVCETLEAAGIMQYEISNFARPGRESRHNLHYWRCDDYLGLGPAASSCIGGARFTVAPDVDGYIDGQVRLAEHEQLSDADRELEYFMLGLRLVEGVRRDDCAARFGGEVYDKYAARLRGYVAQGLTTVDERRLALTRRGMLVSNSILCDILEL